MQQRTRLPTTVALVAAPTLIGLLLLAVLRAGPVSTPSRDGSTATATAAPPAFVLSVDTMKESMDTDAHPLTTDQIAGDVGAMARLNPTYITVDTFMDYPDYMQRWVAAVRATGRRVWFRLHPNAWEGNNGAAPSLTPRGYEEVERRFIAAHHALFRPDDILDPCPEPENGRYWRATYGANWSAVKAATDAYNRFIVDTTAVADQGLHAAGVAGVVTTVRSVTAWFAARPAALYPSTTATLGRVTVDSYPERNTVDPAAATRSRLDELATIEATRHVPLIIGELGYSVRHLVDDATQERVLTAEFAALRSIPYLAGVNYWVGLGNPALDGTRLFDGLPGAWSPRPAARILVAFFQDEARMRHVHAAPTPPRALAR